MDERTRDTTRTCVVDVTKRLIRIIKRSLAARDRPFGKFNKSFLTACAVAPVDTAASLSLGLFAKCREIGRVKEREKRRGRPRIPNTWLLIILFYFHSRRFVLFCLRGSQHFIVLRSARRASNERRPKRK